ncbi:hypothetical protein [Pseudomonas marginalis]|uniref:hypothetical protein n=1 Tax=Pseudomonas marginalis TaxID=298 RepID=UPI00203370C0|nr:hypothetical protein [Pseudomonas marginalis]MCM2377003.1 hypothetical protein [Pseudomonas marginalis]
MTISNIHAPVLAPLAAPASTPAPALPETVNPVRNEQISSPVLPRMQNMGLTNLRQTVLQGINNQLNSYFVPALHSMSSEKAKGAALTVSGAAAKIFGKSMMKSGSPTSKAVGTALMWGGKTAEKIGKNTYIEAGKDNSTGSYNAYSPRNWVR